MRKWSAWMGPGQGWHLPTGLSQPGISPPGPTKPGTSPQCPSLAWPLPQFPPSPDLLPSMPPYPSLGLPQQPPRTRTRDFPWASGVLESRLISLSVSFPPPEILLPVRFRHTGPMVKRISCSHLAKNYSAWFPRFICKVQNRQIHRDRKKMSGYA